MRKADQLQSRKLARRRNRKRLPLKLWAEWKIKPLPVPRKLPHYMEAEMAILAAAMLLPPQILDHRRA